MKKASYNPFVPLDLKQNENKSKKKLNQGKKD